jgi:HEAT repeat protein
VLEAELAAAPDARRREMALIGLGNVGGDPSIIDVAEPYLKDDDPQVRIAAATALRRVGNERAADIIFDALAEEPETRVRDGMVDLFEELTPVEYVVEKAVAFIENEKDASVRRRAAIKLGTMGPGGKAALGQFRNDPDEGVRAIARYNTEGPSGEQPEVVP